jgi:serine/threonine protein kinase, bacterial
MPLANGQIFAGYRILRRLGSGAMGEVYLAQHPRLPRQDALKVLAADVSADADYRARFNREADLASTLWHPHIVGVHDRGEEEGQLWISMDFVDGLDAARLLADRYPAGMPVEEVARIVTAVASALDYAHKQGLLHRDVKPANIMMTNLDDEGEQRILLTDFGIARNVNDISGLTATNMTVGTVAYCAPEQLLGEDIDGRADQYSLAATAFHLLTGSQLFPNSNPAVVISHHLNVPPPAVANSRPELAKLDLVLAVGLAKQPNDRFRRRSDFAHALSKQIDSVGAPTQTAPTSPAPVTSAAPKVDSVPSQGESVDRKAGKSRVIAAAAAVVAAILIAGLIVTWRPWERQAPLSSRESPGPASSSSTATSSITTLTTTGSSTTATSSITSTTTPLAAPPPATRANTGTQSDINTLVGALSKGYGLNNCTPQNLQTGVLAFLSCGQSADPSGPVLAKYMLFDSSDTLAGWFKTSIKDDVLTKCADQQSPTTWHLGNSTTNAGHVACGTYQNAAEIIWTTDAKNVLSYIRAGNTDVPALYEWWRTNG